jgi:putative ATP-dependent endonuclease of OLD family
MRIEKVNIENYKCFKERFTVNFQDGVNILVGDNEAGKSTILEAINLAVSGTLNGRFLKNELSQYLFNYSIVSEYLTALNKKANPNLPAITIEVFFADCNEPILEGNGNQDRLNASGVQFRVEFDESYKTEYQTLIDTGEQLSTLPIEYYKVSWMSFAREGITYRTIPLKSVLIDSTSSKYQNGSDIYISKIIKNDLDDTEKVKLSQAYRRMKDSFMLDDSINAINDKITSSAKISDKKLNISVDLSTQNSWETALMTYLDDVPFHQIGKGEQCIIKTNLALAKKKKQEASLILIEEPENHLSHTRLNQLIKSIADSCLGKQVILTTHSSYVANKLGLEKLILLNNRKTLKLSELQNDTFEFFKKLPGYQTLRGLLSRKTILVEGDSDELIFQRCYMDLNNGRLPIEDGIEVISVKLTFKRFLDIAVLIEKPTAVITDNDGDHANTIIKKYLKYHGNPNIRIFADPRDKLNTLEPQFIEVNKGDLDYLCKGLGLNTAKYDTVDKINEYMIGHKTEWALKIFETDDSYIYPNYIVDAVRWSNE